MAALRTHLLERLVERAGYAAQRSSAPRRLTVGRPMARALAGWFGLFLQRVAAAYPMNGREGWIEFDGPKAVLRDRFAYAQYAVGRGRCALTFVEDGQLGWAFDALTAMLSLMHPYRDGNHCLRAAWLQLLRDVLGADEIVAGKDSEDEQPATAAKQALATYGLHTLAQPVGRRFLGLLCIAVQARSYRDHADAERANQGLDGVHYQLAPLEDAVCANPGVAASEAHRNGMRLNGGFGPATLARALTTVVVPTNNCPMTAAVIGKASYGTKVCPHAWPSLDWKHLAWRIESLNAHTAPLDNDSYVLAPPQRAVVAPPRVTMRLGASTSTHAGVRRAWAAGRAKAENAETTALRLIAALILDPDTLRQRSLVWWLQLLLKPALAFPAQQARTGAAPPEGAPAPRREVLHPSTACGSPRCSCTATRASCASACGDDAPGTSALDCASRSALSSEDAEAAERSSRTSRSPWAGAWPRARTTACSVAEGRRRCACFAQRRRFAGLGSEPTAESQAQSSG